MSLLFDRYCLNSVLSRSSFSTVISATDTQSLSSNLVALKIFQSEDDFSTEDRVRKHHFHLLMNVLGHQDSYSSLSATDLTYLSSFQVLPPVSAGCLVLPLAGMTLRQSLQQGCILSPRDLFRGVLSAVASLHACNLVHCNLSPSNFVLVGAEVFLIDLAGCVPIGEAKPARRRVAFRAGTAWVPPEAMCAEREFPVDVIRVSYDVWSLGCLLFLMITQSHLLPCDLKDNLDQAGIETLQRFEDEFKHARLSLVEDRNARTLLSWMLSFNAHLRPSVARIQAHPYMSGRTPIRMVGQAPAYDVFISYRVRSDTALALKLYETLTSQGIRVFLDRKCMKPGEDWEKAVLNGMAQAKAVAVILSTPSMANWCNITENGIADNLAVEFLLALELQEASLVEFIIPIIVGTLDESTETYGRPDFRALSGAPDIVVSSIQEKLDANLDQLCMGPPNTDALSMKAMQQKLLSFQGIMVNGPAALAVEEATNQFLQFIKLKPGDSTYVEVSATHKQREELVLACRDENRAQFDVLTAREAFSVETDSWVCSLS